MEQGRNDIILKWNKVEKEMEEKCNVVLKMRLKIDKNLNKIKDLFNIESWNCNSQSFVIFQDILKVKKK